MRTFIAVPLPPDCHSVLEQMQRRMREFGADVRWTSIPSIHLTLKFLGETDRGLLPQLNDALRSIPAASRFGLRIRGVGGFPNLHNPRVIWCGIEESVEQLKLLQANIEQACTGLGFPREERAFQPHLTLGRVQGKRNLQPLLDYIRIGCELECAFIVDHFSIFESVLTPGGPIYTTLAKLDLG